MLPRLVLNVALDSASPYNLPVSLRDVATATMDSGLPRISVPAEPSCSPIWRLSEGAEIELTLKMPSEITLGENMRVRCRAVFCES